jgi:hypothetical protein
VRCRACGTTNEAGSNFCIRCGAPLLSEATEPLGRVEDDLGADVETALENAVGPDLRQASLVVTNGALRGSSFLLDRDITTIGRDPASHVFLDDVTVSRHHAEIHRVGVWFFINDVGSLNGTYVGSGRVDQAELHDRDELRIGRFRVIFLSG